MRKVQFLVALAVFFLAQACFDRTDIFGPSQSQSQGSGASPSPTPSGTCNVQIFKVFITGPTTFVHGSQQTYSAIPTDQAGNELPNACLTNLNASWSPSGVISLLGDQSGLNVQAQASVPGAASLSVSVGGVPSAPFPITVQ